MNHYQILSAKLTTARAKAKLLPNRATPSSAIASFKTAFRVASGLALTVALILFVAILFKHSTLIDLFTDSPRSEALVMLAALGALQYAVWAFTIVFPLPTLLALLSGKNRPRAKEVLIHPRYVGVHLCLAAALTPLLAKGMMGMTSGVADVWNSVFSSPLDPPHHLNDLNDVQWLLAFVCLESTGPYGEALAEYLVEHQVKVSMINPVQIKHYAKTILSRNKNDRVDAKIIARYAEKFRLREFIPQSKDQKLSRESIQLLDTLMEQKRQLQNQLESVRSKEIRKEIEAIIHSIEKRLERIEKMLNTCIQHNEVSQANKKRLLTIVGIGEKTANRIIAYFPDVSQFSCAKQLAAYTGLSPRQYQSGQYQGKTRISKCGNAKLRKALYMPALVVKNKNSHFKFFCERLEKKGLRPKQIICAVMRKLIHIVFGILKHQKDFDPTLV